jgi:hypothetical protein
MNKTNHLARPRTGFRCVLEGRVTRARRGPEVEWLSWSTLRAFQVQPIGYPHDPYFLPFSQTVMFLASRGCRTTARRRVLVLSLGFRATRCTDPDGSKNVSPAL